MAARSPRTAGVGEDTDVYYDVAARAAGEHKPTRDQVRQMLQELLADRFRIVVQRESRDAGLCPDDRQKGFVIPPLVSVRMNVNGVNSQPSVALSVNHQ